MSSDEIGLLAEIDRSEQLETLYRVVDGELVADETDFFVPSWDPDGDGDHSVARIIGFADPVVQGGASFFGAFRGPELLGLVIVDAGYRPTVAWLALLHVTSPARRAGVASALWTAAAEVAHEAGAETMYVSSAPTGSAVGFYMSRGCRLATKDEIIPELFELEPEDVHLVCELVSPA